MTSHDPGTVDVYGQWVRAGRRRQGEPDPLLPSLFDQEATPAEKQAGYWADATTDYAPAIGPLLALPDPTEPVVAPVGMFHPETSVEAAQAVAPKAASQRAKLLDALAVSVWGLTAAEAAEIIGRSRNQTSARLGELRAAGWAQYATDENEKVITRSTGADSRCRGSVHILTDEGRARWRQTQ